MVTTTRPCYTIPPLLALALASNVHAAGLDCKRAASATERAICADPGLRRLDATLATTYAQALAEASAEGPAARDKLRQRQREWLAARDACGADTPCLTQSYRQRIASFAKPDAADMAALEELRRAVEAMRKSDPESPLDKAVERFKITQGMTSFSNEEDPDDPGGDARFPRTRPDGVSAAEWRALQASRIDGGGENGRASYTLMDLDGDGLRDLVVDTYTGGTGLYSTVEALRQQGGKFVVPGGGPVPGKDASPDAQRSYLYSMAGRGAGAGTAAWVRLNGRVYAAFQTGTYGMDDVSLLRPWAGPGQVPQLTLRYRYSLAVPAVQQSPDQPARRLAPALHAALQQALARAPATATQETGPRTTPLCPVPANASEEMREARMSYGPGHYTLEIVAEMPVHIGAACHLGQLRNWFGGYAPGTGLAAELCVRKPEDTESEECYTVNGPRTVIGIESGMAPFEY